MTAATHQFITRDKQFIPCVIVKEGPYGREVKFLEGEQKGKTSNVHPVGVAWGQMYPRLFAGKVAPESCFVHQGRVMVQTAVLDDAARAAIPSVNPHYRFQPFLTHVIDSIHGRENVILTGGTGVGKTTHITQLAARINQPLLRINFNGETRMSDLVGKIQVVDGETRWVDGILPMAMRRGWWLLLDELDFADPAVLSLLHPVLEEEPMLVLKENSGEIIRPHENFRLFATANSIGAMQDRAGAYAGTVQMNEAFLDRWQVIFVDNLKAEEEIKVIKLQVPGLKTAWVKGMVDFANRARNREKIGAYEFAGDNFSTRKVLAWAKKTALHRDAVKGAKLAWVDKMPASDQDPALHALKVHFGSTKRKLKRERT